MFSYQMCLYLLYCYQLTYLHGLSIWNYFPLSSLWYLKNIVLCKNNWIIYLHLLKNIYFAILPSWCIIFFQHRLGQKRISSVTVILTLPMLDINCVVLLKCLKILPLLFINSQSCDIFLFLGFERVCQTRRYFRIYNRCCRMESRSGTCTTTTESHD